MSSPIHQGRVAGTHWDPNQYLKFADHRLRPALELLERIPIESPRVIYDIWLRHGADHPAHCRALAGRHADLRSG
ncbi:MAG: hypothetical protein R2911_36330 [Caldilineaceae bacterium]